VLYVKNVKNFTFVKMSDMSRVLVCVLFGVQVVLYLIVPDNARYESHKTAYDC
jgi:hypothetical protein